jgi:hypothetical protein
MTVKTAAHWTVAVIAAVTVLLIAWDFFVGLKYGSEATESWIVWTLAQRYPTLPFAAGYLCGHLFANLGSKPEGGSYNKSSRKGA